MQQRHNAESFLGFSSNEEGIRKLIQEKLYRLSMVSTNLQLTLTQKYEEKASSRKTDPNINKISVDIREMMLEDSRWKNKSCVNSLIIIYPIVKLQMTDDNTDIKLYQWDIIWILKTFKAVLHVFYHCAVKKLISLLYNSQTNLL